MENDIFCCDVPSASLLCSKTGKFNTAMTYIWSELLLLFNEPCFCWISNRSN